MPTKSRPLPIDQGFTLYHSGFRHNLINSNSISIINITTAAAGSTLNAAAT
jgi:hypothetical protein